MKVLITHEIFAPDYFGGGEMVVFEIAKRLKERGIKIEILTTGNPKIKQFKGIKTIRLPVNRYLMNLSALWIYKYAKNFDLIQTNNYNACFPSFLAAKWLEKPIVCLVHGMYGSGWIDMRGPILGRLSRWIEKIQICHEFDKIIFLSYYARDEGLKIGIPKEITEVIRPGIIRGFNNYKVSEKEGFVLFVGRLAKQKGLDYLIEAAKELSNVKFILVGSGEEEEKLKSIAPQNVEFYGFVPDKKLIELYAKAPIFCLPSIGEGFGLVLVEAMASSCAIVSTVPLDYEGFKVDPKNTRQLVNAIGYLIKNQKKTLKMGKKNRQKAKGYDWNKFTEKLIKIYEEILKK